MKKIISLVLSATLVMTALIGCGGANSDGEPQAEGVESKDIIVGVSMPTKSLQRWNQDGANMEVSLKAKG